MVSGKMGGDIIKARDLSETYLPTYQELLYLSTAEAKAAPLIQKRLAEEARANAAHEKASQPNW